MLQFILSRSFSRSYCGLLCFLLFLTACATTEHTEEKQQNIKEQAEIQEKKQENTSKNKNTTSSDKENVKPEVYLADAAKIAEEQNDILASAAYWAAAHKQAPNNEEILLGYARTSRKLGMANRALETMYSFIAKNPKSARIHYELSKSLTTIGQHREAQKHIDQATTLDTQKWHYFSLKGVLFDRLSRFNEAESSYKKALSLKPDNWVVLNNYAMSLHMAGKLEDAEKTVRQAATLPNAKPIVHLNLARILMSQGKLEDAEKSLINNLPSSQAAAALQELKKEYASPVRWKNVAG